MRGDREWFAEQKNIKELNLKYKKIYNDLYKRLRSAEEQGRNRSGETNVEASAILSRLHQTTR